MLIEMEIEALAVALRHPLPLDEWDTMIERLYERSEDATEED